jgi:hypothetical protein
LSDIKILLSPQSEKVNISKQVEEKKRESDIRKKDETKNVPEAKVSK